MPDHEPDREPQQVDEDKRDYAEGQKDEEVVEAPRRFSEGQEKLPHPPAEEHGGDFAEGQEVSPLQTTRAASRRARARTIPPRGDG